MLVVFVNNILIDNNSQILKIICDNMNNIEFEIRSFISKDKYNELIEFFKNNAEFLNEDYQETYYFDTKKT